RRRPSSSMPAAMLSAIPATQNLAALRVDSAQFAFVGFPRAVPEFAIDPRYASDETAARIRKPQASNARRWIERSPLGERRQSGGSVDQRFLDQRRLVREFALICSLQRQHAPRLRVTCRRDSCCLIASFRRGRKRHFLNLST